MNPLDLIREHQSNLSQEIEKKMVEYMQTLRKGSNFLILPIKKTLEKEGCYHKRVSYSCIVMNGKWKDTIFIDSDWILDTLNFQKSIMKYVGLEVYGLEITKNDKVTKDVKQRLFMLKKFLDFCDTSKVLAIQEQVSYFWYWRETQFETTFANGILYLNKKEFIAKNSSIRNHHIVKYYPWDDLSLQECLSQFSQFPKDIFKSDEHRFVLWWFFTASIRADEFFEYYQNFPQFYIFWPRWTGKSFVNRLLMSIVWFTKADLIDLSKITPFTMIDQMNSLKWYIFADEYSSVRKFKSFVNNTLRSNYDRTLTSRGTIGGKFENNWPYSNHYANDSVICYWGETLPDDEALLTRMVPIEAESWFTYEIWYLPYKELVTKYRKIFFNIIKNKMELDIVPYIEQAQQILEKYKVIVKEQRTKNNITILLAGNLIIWNTDEGWLINNVYDYLKSYDTLFQVNTITYDILDDIVNFPDEYLALNKIIDKQQKYPIFIYSNQLIIGIRQLISMYQFRHKDRDMEKPKIENELKLLLWISGKISKKEFNYSDFIGNRPKWPAIPYGQVKKNIHTARLWNTFLSKLDHDRQNPPCLINEDTMNNIDACLSTHQMINLDDFWESEKQEKEKN